jgi:molecular chaperone DnaK
LREWVLGIDLGTTNTAAVAFGPAPGPMSILHGRNRPVMPSVVSFKNPRLPIVGWIAKDMLLSDPITTIFGWKRFLGRPEKSEYVSRHRDRFPFRIHADPDGQLGAVVGGEVIPFVEVAALVLEQVRLQASAALSAEIKKCVISVPAHFANAQRDTVLEAGRRAGLDVLKLVNEPTAAALAFGIDQRLDSRVLIFDLGGGTFDSTILEVVDNIFDVKATQGDGFLGGTDFDRAVMNHLVEFCKSKHNVDITEEPVVAQRVLNAAEAAKIALSQQEAVRIQVPLLGTDRRGFKFDLDYTLTRAELERLTAPLVEKTIGIIEKMLMSEGLSPRDIDYVIAVGGQSRMPLVRRRLAQVLRKEPLGHLDPDTCIAHGAALVAKSQADLGGAVLLDVLSVPIGVVFPGGRTEFVFEANTSLPSTAVVRLPDPGDRGLVIGFWQGADVTSSERQVLGVVRMSPNLFNVGTDFGLEVVMSEGLELRVKFTSSLERVPLLLERPRRA